MTNRAAQPMLMADSQSACLVGSIAVYAALQSGSLSLLGFGADAVIDAFASIVLVGAS